MPITARSSASHPRAVSVAGPGPPRRAASPAPPVPVPVPVPAPGAAEPVAADAEPDQVLMGIWQATANQVRGLEPSLETAGPACQINAFPELGC